jgi:predicted metal-binding membrane protein
MTEMRESTDLAHLAVLWAVMMAAMMPLTAVPRIVRGGPLFAGGYVGVWVGFGAVAAIAQWYLGGAGLLSDAMSMRSTLLGAVLLVGAGIYELTPWKAAFLAQCRLGRCDAGISGAPEALLTGVRQGACCVGCCWALMALLFVVGVMNVVAMAALVGIVALQKLSRPDLHVERAVSGLLLAWGIAMAAFRV